MSGCIMTGSTMTGSIMTRTLLGLSILAVALMLLPGSVRPANAESKTAPANTTGQSPGQSSSQTGAPDTQFRIPDGPVLSILIRRTLLTLNDANLTGNYTVLRDVAAPGFRDANDAAKLSAIFAELRTRKIDLAPILYFDPKLVRQPEINASGMLRVSGFIPTRPEQINFDMLFQYVAQRWRIFGIAVNTTLSAETAAPAPAPPADKPAPKAKTAPAKASTTSAKKKR